MASFSIIAYSLAVAWLTATGFSVAQATTPTPVPSADTSAAPASAKMSWSGQASPNADDENRCGVLRYSVDLADGVLAIALTPRSGREVHATTKLKDDGSFATSAAFGVTYSIPASVKGHISGGEGTMSVVQNSITAKGAIFGGCAWRDIELKQ